MPGTGVSEPIEAFATLHECCATARVARIHLFGTFALARSFSTQCAGLARLTKSFEVASEVSLRPRAHAKRCRGLQSSQKRKGVKNCISTFYGERFSARRRASEPLRAIIFGVAVP